MLRRQRRLAQNTFRITSFRVLENENPSSYWIAVGKT